MKKSAKFNEDINFSSIMTEIREVFTSLSDVRKGKNISINMSDAAFIIHNASTCG